MAFPSILVILFFVTLNFNYRVLYAPSDFKDETIFLKIMQKATPREKAEKLREELLDVVSEKIDSETSAHHMPHSEKTDEEKELTYRQIVRRNAQTNYVLAEELVLNKLSSELNVDIQRDIAITTEHGSFVFDGVYIKNDRIYAIEIKYSEGYRVHKDKLSRTLERAQKISEDIQIKKNQQFILILGLVTDAPSAKLDNLKERAMIIVNHFNLQVDLRVYSLELLEKEAGLYCPKVKE